jgi:hypothetical protein
VGASEMEDAAAGGAGVVLEERPEAGAESDFSRFSRSYGTEFDDTIHTRR